MARLLSDGKPEVPVYAIGADRRVDSRTFDLTGSSLFTPRGSSPPTVDGQTGSFG